jgi:cell division cycle protein 20 (cofactor of APC complex)
VLGTALSPDGCTVATGAADENLKFWRIWEAKAAKKDTGDNEAGARSKSAVRIR